MEMDFSRKSVVVTKNSPAGVIFLKHRVHFWNRGNREIFKFLVCDSDANGKWEVLSIGNSIQ